MSHRSNTNRPGRGSGVYSLSHKSVLLDAGADHTPFVAFGVREHLEGPWRIGMNPANPIDNSVLIRVQTPDIDRLHEITDLFRMQPAAQSIEVSTTEPLLIRRPSFYDTVDNIGA